MLGRYVSDARAAEVPWDEARAARVVERAVRARPATERRRPSGWVLALAGASVGATLFAFRPTASSDAAPGATEPGPAVVRTPSDKLDGGQHTG